MNDDSSRALVVLLIVLFCITLVAKGGDVGGNDLSGDRGKIEVLVVDDALLKEARIGSNEIPVVLSITAPEGVMLDNLGHMETGERTERYFATTFSEKGEVFEVGVSVDENDSLSIRKVSAAVRRLIDAATKNIKKGQRLRIYLLFRNLNQLTENDKLSKVRTVGQENGVKP